MLCGTAFKNKGVQPLLDAIVDCLPSPLDIPPARASSRQGPRGASSARPTTNEPFAALAFKIMADPYVGKLTYFRVYSGTLEKGGACSTLDQGRKPSASAASC